MLDQDMPIVFEYAGKRPYFVPSGGVLIKL